MNKTNRMIICAKDIVCITGKTERTARRMLAKVKTIHHKPKGGLVTLEEFCNNAGLKTADVLEFLK